MARSQRQATGTVRLTIPAELVQESVQLQLCVALPGAANITGKLLQLMQRRLDEHAQVLRARKLAGLRLGAVRLVHSAKPSQKQVATGLRMIVAAPPAAAAQLYSMLSQALTFTMGEGEDAMTVGVRPAQGHIPVLIRGVPMAISPEAVEATINSNADCGVSVFPGTMRWGSSISGGIANDCMFAVLKCTPSTPPPKQICFSLPGGDRIASVHALPGAIPCMPMPPSIRHMLNQQRHQQQQQAGPAPAAGASTYAEAVAAQPPAREAPRTPRMPQAGDADDRPSRVSSGSGSSVSMTGLSTGAARTPQSAAVPSAHAHTSSSPQAAGAGAPASAPVHSEPSSSVAQPDGDQPDGFQTVRPKRVKRAAVRAAAAARAVAAATAGLAIALSPEAGGGGASSLGQRQAGGQGVGNKDARLRPPKGGSATPSPEAKAARIEG
jgi:hypothetical protein